MYELDEYGCLDVRSQHLTSLPELPKGIKKLCCLNNELTSLPELPDTLIVLDCSRNEIRKLPILPASLSRLDCDYNPLKCLIHTKFIHMQNYEWMYNYYHKFIRSYSGQKIILNDDLTQLEELKKQTQIHPRIKDEFAFMFHAINLNLL